MLIMKIQYMVLHMTVGLSFQRQSSCQWRKDGITVDEGCVQVTCWGGIGVPNPDKILHTCKKCNAHGDPHFIDFSGAKFDWHDPCNYALVQEGITKYPEFGVFMDFEQFGDWAYVGSPTTYQEDKNTKVKVVDLYDGYFFVELNGYGDIIYEKIPRLLENQGQYPSVWAWVHTSVVSIEIDTTTFETKEVKTHCLRLYGKPKILVELCDSQITIWAPPKSFLNGVTLGGLCGSTDFTALEQQQLVARDGTTYPNPGDWGQLAHTKFGNSWKAEEQFKGTCTPGGRKKRSPRKLRSAESEHGNLHSECVEFMNSSHSESHHHHEICSGVHKGIGSIGSDDHLGSCKFDLCIVANYTGPRNAKFTVDNMIKHHWEIHARTRIHNINTIEYIPDENFVPDDICGISNFDGSRPTHNGTNHEIHYGEFPWMVAVLRQDNNEYRAGGSLVHRRVVITAAHKVYDNSDFVASIGDWDLPGISDKDIIAAQTINVREVVFHPDFSRETLENNVALLILESDAVLGDTVMPICLPEPGQVFDGAHCTVTGWGGDSPKVLKKVIVQAVNHNECQTILRNSRLGSNFNLHDSFNCAVGEGEDSCNVDGGSPLICPNPTKPTEYIQIGVVSWGIDCGINGNPAVYGSVPKTLNWITEEVRRRL